MFCLPYFWHSPKSSLSLQYQMSCCTMWAKNIWTYFKFEKQLAWWAVPSYWPTSHTVVFGATAHTAQISMRVLRIVFPGRFIFHFTDILWPVCSLILQNQTTVFGTMSKASKQNTTCQISGLKHWVCRCIKRIHKKFCVVTSFPPWTYDMAVTYV